jgi:hypothetical protein
MKRMLKQKKGLDYYVLILTIVGIWILGFIIFVLFMKETQVSKNMDIGSNQFIILKSYSLGEKALLFVDQASKVSFQQASYYWGKTGFYHDPLETECHSVSDGDTTYWSKDFITRANSCQYEANEAKRCFPTEVTMKTNLGKFFNPLLNGLIAKFNTSSNVTIPFNYGSNDEPFVFSGNGEQTQVIGVSNSPVIVSLTNIKYDVKPSFLEKINPNIIRNGGYAVHVAQKIYENRIKAYGSTIPPKYRGLNLQEIKDITKDHTNTGVPTVTPNPDDITWTVSDYGNERRSCSYVTGSCSCSCPPCDEEGNCATCTGDYITTYDYNRYHTELSATEKQKYLISGTTSSTVEPLVYKFGLSWVDPHSFSDPIESCLCPDYIWPEIRD